MTGRRAVLLALLALLAAPAGADGQAGPRLALEPEEVDFGRVRPGQKLSRELVLRNVGDGELVLERVSSTCSCAVAGGYARTLAPGARTILRIELTTPTRAGRTEQAVRVQSNDRQRPRVEVKVAATVVAPKGRAEGR